MTSTQSPNALILLLEQAQCSLVVQQCDDIQYYRERGVKDLLRLLQHEPQTLLNACVADKVVGKGAAALLILGKVQRIETKLISQSALNLLKKYQIPTKYEQEVPFILNHLGKAPCPVESACEEIETPEQMLPIIERTLETLSHSAK